MARPYSRNGIKLVVVSGIGRYSDANYSTKNYSSRCQQGNHSKCSGKGRMGWCACKKCNHPKPE